MRYIPHTEQDIKSMCEAVGVAQVSDLFKVIPDAMRMLKPLQIPDALSEPELVSLLKHIGRSNDTVDSLASFLGAGAYHHYVPVAIGSLITRGEFLTAYTPYQPEISQGTLQALFEFQTMIASLTGMEVSNASQYDGASSVAEAVLMSLRVSKKNKVIVAKSLHPEYRQVLNTYVADLNCELIDLPWDATGRVDGEVLNKLLDDKTAAVVLQSPNFFGVIEDYAKLEPVIHGSSALMVASFSEAISLALLKPPGAYGADIVAGEGASFGNMLNNGGPYLGLFATQKKFIRNMPGRLCGETIDQNGKRGFVLTLSTREQHIRREKATSNICTNQGLCALAATIYLSLLGPTGLKEVAKINFSNTQYLKKQLSGIGKIAFNGPTFNEFVVDVGQSARPVLTRLQEAGILGGIDLAAFKLGLDRHILVCATEMNNKEQMDQFAHTLKKILS